MYQSTPKLSRQNNGDAPHSHWMALFCSKSCFLLLLSRLYLLLSVLNSPTPWSFSLLRCLRLLRSPALPLSWSRLCLLSQSASGSSVLPLAPLAPSNCPVLIIESSGLPQMCPHLYLARHGRVRIRRVPYPAHDRISAVYCLKSVRICARRMPDGAMSSLRHGGWRAPPQHLMQSVSI
ncbi:hypothetical protein C8R47DRAFT_1151711 [Mycena vitilis]|nr:hypothetical protein C8R47DRAFT_1151711 [Mycena vitilis]